MCPQHCAQCLECSGDWINEGGVWFAQSVEGETSQGKQNSLLGGEGPGPLEQWGQRQGCLPTQLPVAHHAARWASATCHTDLRMVELLGAFAEQPNFGPDLGRTGYADTPRHSWVPFSIWSLATGTGEIGHG